MSGTIMSQEKALEKLTTIRKKWDETIIECQELTLKLDEKEALLKKLAKDQEEVIRSLTNTQKADLVLPSKPKIIV